MRKTASGLSEARRVGGFFEFLFSDPQRGAPSWAAATIITDQLSSNDSGDYAQKIDFYWSLEPVPF